MQPKLCVYMYLYRYACTYILSVDVNWCLHLEMKSWKANMILMNLPQPYFKAPSFVVVQVL